MPSQSSLIDLLNWKISEYDPLHSVREVIWKTNWVKLCQRASELNHGLACMPLSKMTNGLHNLVCILQFSDQTRWVARIGLHRSAADSAKLRNEVDAMQLIKEKCKFRVPHVFAYEIDDENPVGVPFILMEFLPGNTAMDAAGGYDVHRGQIPFAYRQIFYRSVAECHVQITALRFSKIGTIVRSAEGEYNIGPFPDIGGPFDSATSFFEAWAEHIRFPLGKDRILEIMKGGPAQRVLAAINEFPSQIKAVARRMSCNNHGPFPLCHADFLHSNIVVDESFQVLGIIDWEGACTLPLQLVTFPGFLNVMPISFDSPDNYHEDGQPVDGQQRQRWKDREDYVQMVESVEHKDHVLSRCLRDEKSLALAYSMMAYKSGKLGFYDKVIDEQ
ncbi:kinase-like domain-containing protein [Xylaria sp. FL0064]|nr:kinase-like domain-containing protein [Xylaria sp. FL0064]